MHNFVSATGVAKYYSLFFGAHFVTSSLAILLYAVCYPIMFWRIYRIGTSPNQLQNNENKDKQQVERRLATAGCIMCVGEGDYILIEKSRWEKAAQHAFAR